MTPNFSGTFNGKMKKNRYSMKAVICASGVEFHGLGKGYTPAMVYPVSYPTAYVCRLVPMGLELVRF